MWRIMFKKLTLFVCLCVLFLFSASAFGAISARFSPALNLVASKKADETSIFAKHFSIFSHPVTHETTLGVLIKFKDASYASGLKKAGGQVHTVLPSGIATAWVPLSILDAIRNLDGIEYVELAAKNHPLLDVSRPEIGIDKVHSGQGLPAACKGKGVIVGVIDSGIDFDHPDFKNPDGSTRVAYIWDQCATKGTPPEGYDYGNECDSGEINSGNCPEQDNNVEAGGHGTHVAGTAAGNGRAPNNNADYTGIAPEADIIVGALSDCLYDNKIIDAANYIFSKAKDMGKPSVINMSFGGHHGPHDGTSLFEQALTELTGPGKIIVASAGNEGNKFIHLGYQADDKGETSLFLPSKGAQVAEFDVWYSPNYQMDVMLGQVDAKTGKIVEYKGWIPPDQFIYEKFSTGQEVFIDATETSNPQNGDRHVFMGIYGEGFDQYHWAIGFKAHQTGQTATFDCWSSVDYTGQFTQDVKGHKPGDNLKTVGIPGTARSIIAVAAYNTKNQWVDMNGQKWIARDVVIGDRADFSSIGPSRDGRLKPEIAAPGFVIASALTSDIPIGENGTPPQYVVLGGYYQIMYGTSMACSHVTGTVALILQQNPTLNYDQVMEILAKSARSDQYTGPSPNTMWGYGKVDGYAAVAAALHGSGSEVHLGEQKVLHELLFSSLCRQIGVY